MPTGTALTSDAVIYLPGIMGSELVNDQGKVLWGARLGTAIRQVFLRDVFDRLVPRPDDGIRASQPIKFPSMIPFLSSMEPYSNLDKRLRQTVVHPNAVLAYPYDWRHSVADAAAGLVPVARRHLATWREQFAALPADERKGLPTPQLTLVGHSMGGLVASSYTAQHQDEGASDVRRVITLGTPFQGSLAAVRVLATGEKLPFGLFAKSLRNAARTMPGLYELLPRYKAVDDDGDRRRLVPADISGVGASADIAAQAFDTLDGLTSQIATLAPDVFRCLIGTSQPTLQSVTFTDGEPAFAEEITDNQGARADHRGDGTVFRYSASVPNVTASPVPQCHGALAKTTEGTEFATAMATERELGDFQSASELGLRTPEMVEVGDAFDIEATLESDSSVGYQLHNAETNVLVKMGAMSRVDGAATARVTATKPGLHRISVAASGFSPVERLVLVLEP